MRALKMTVEHTQNLLTLSQYGKLETELEVTSDVMAEAGFLFSALYQRAEFKGNMDALRAHLFATAKGNLRCLPPTKDAFRLHVLRGLHQIAVSKRAHLSHPVYPTTTCFGPQVKH
jgi:hypothetical protein